MKLKEMFAVRLLLLTFLCLQCVQFKVCESSPESKSTDLISNTRLERLPRSRTGLFQRQVQERCPGNAKTCRDKQNYKLKRDKNRKKEKRCCKTIDKACQKRIGKRCQHKRTKCIIRQSRRCQKQFSRCNKRKSANRRAMKCGHSKKKNPNLHRPIRPTKEPEHKKLEKEECNHSEECEEGLCCARHRHKKICKPLIQKGQVCTKDFRSQKRSPEMFERCPCAEGLTCAASEERHFTCQILT